MSIKNSYVKIIFAGLIIAIFSVFFLMYSNKSIEKIMKKYDVPGLSIVTIENGDIILQKVYGFKNAEKRDLIDENTLFEAASMSKPLFAYGVLKMVESGKLDLDKPLSEYFVYSNVKDDSRLAKITARMVLNHTTGFPNWRQKGKDLKIYFEPGERFSYSGEGFVYLQKVVEKISGQSLEEYMQKNVLIPLGMTHSSYILKKEQCDQKAFGHDFTGHPLPRGVCELENANGAASLHTTACDYAKFVQAIIKNMGLKPETINEMLYSQIVVGSDGHEFTDAIPKELSKTISWGLGWGLQKTEKGLSFWHWGDNDGFKCYVVGSKDDGNAIIIFTNSDNGIVAISEIVENIIEIVENITGISHPALKWLNYKITTFKWLDYKMPKKRKVFAINPEVYDRYVGTYKAEKEPFTFIVTKEQNKLFIELVEQKDKREVYPESETEFFLTSIDVQFSFVKDKAGEFTKLILHQDGNDTACDRVQK